MRSSADGQLDECDLTLQELTTIREAMISALNSHLSCAHRLSGFQSSQCDWTTIRTHARRQISTAKNAASLTTAPHDVPINEAAKLKTKPSAARVAKR